MADIAFVILCNSVWKAVEEKHLVTCVLLTCYCWFFWIMCSVYLDKYNRMDDYHCFCTFCIISLGGSQVATYFLIT